MVLFPIFILFATSSCVNLALTRAAAKLMRIGFGNLSPPFFILATVYHHFKCVSTLLVNFFHFSIAIISLLVYYHF